MRRLLGIMAAAALALGLGTAAQASTIGYISAQGSDGNVYRVNLETGSVTLAASLGTAGPTQPANDQFSPNALGFGGNGIYFRANFGNATTTNYLFRNDENMGVLPASGFAIAAGDVKGDTYYYVDGAGHFRSASGIYGAAGSLGTTDFGFVLEGAPAFLGDIAISGGTGYLSYSLENTGQHKFAAIDLATGTAVTINSDAERRYAGLAFSMGELYGFAATPTDGTGASNGIGIFRIDLGTGNGTLVSNLSGVPAGVLLTDAAPAPIPLPAAGWLLLGGLGALAAVRRRRRAAAA